MGMVGKWTSLGISSSFFMKWNFISFLPSMLITPFVAQKTKNTWVSLLIHGVPNTILWILLLSGILGIG